MLSKEMTVKTDITYAISLTERRHLEIKEDTNCLTRNLGWNINQRPYRSTKYLKFSRKCNQGLISSISEKQRTTFVINCISKNRSSVEQENPLF